MVLVDLMVPAGIMDVVVKMEDIRKIYFTSFLKSGVVNGMLIQVLIVLQVDVMLVEQIVQEDK